MIEQLETRRLLAGIALGNLSVKLRGDTLLIRGSDAADRFSITPDGRYFHVLLDVGAPLTINGVGQPFGKSVLADQVHSIRILLGAGDNSVLFQDLNIPGDLDIHTASGADIVNIAHSTVQGQARITTSGDSDIVNLSQSTFRQAATIRTGDGPDTIILDDDTFDGDMLVKAGDGPDTVNYAGSVFNARARIKGDSGLDLLSNQATLVDTNFNSGADGWRPGFADYSAYGGEYDGNGNLIRTPEQFYQLHAGIRPLPDPLTQAGDGMLLSGYNHSDSLFMYLWREVDSLAPGQTYLVNFDVQFASSAPAGAVGAGGPPAESLFVKVGASPRRPAKSISPIDATWSLDVDKGDQAFGGTEMSVAGDIRNGAKTSDSYSGAYKLTSRAHVHPYPATADARGRVWLLVGTESGIEAPTTLYYTRIRANLVPLMSRRVAGAQPTQQSL